MAYPTVDKPYGLKPINLIGGQPFAGSTRELPIQYAYAADIFYGGPAQDGGRGRHRRRRRGRRDARGLGSLVRIAGARQGEGFIAVSPEARKKFWADMEAAGLTIKTEPYHTSIPRAQRGGGVVEPMLSTQWYVKIKPLAEKAYRAVETGQIKIIPERFEKVSFNWMNPETIKDWCISRQLWWGHRIPVWTCDACGHEFAARVDPTECPKCQDHHLRQDPDVLDTWFSSGLWPFSTLGWPDETPDLKTFYPTSVLVNLSAWNACRPWN